MSTKTCKKCSQEKPLEAFHRAKASKDGRNSRCAECKNAYLRKNVQARKDQYEENRKRRAEELHASGQYPHGTYRGYTSGCRCADCTEASRLHHADYKQRVPAVKNYINAHARLRKELGSASRQKCVDCGEQAAHWSWSQNRESEGYRSGQGVRSLIEWSEDPDDYTPRCMACHSAFDSVDK